jgi:hypothetical protein
MPDRNPTLNKISFNIILGITLAKIREDMNGIPLKCVYSRV